MKEITNVFLSTHGTCQYHDIIRFNHYDYDIMWALNLLRGLHGCPTCTIITTKRTSEATIHKRKNLTHIPCIHSYTHTHGKWQVVQQLIATNVVITSSARTIGPSRHYAMSRCIWQELINNTTGELLAPEVQPGPHHVMAWHYRPDGCFCSFC